MKVPTNGGAQLPHDVRVWLGIPAGDQIVVLIEEIIKSPKVEF